MSRATISTDITAFLPGPATRAQALLAEQLRDGVAARVMLIGIEAAASSAPAAATASSSDASSSTADASEVARLSALSAMSRQLSATLRADPQFAYVQNGEAAALDAELAALLSAR
ncbi:MAG: hypothetical protein MUC68_17170, partial [Burkholderiaceae bacterium]|nr:hypothetical protein [Burkholderiaceae bacterium]